MDKELLPSIDNGHGEADGIKTKPKSKKGNGAKEGSTHLPKFPAVNIKTSDLTTRTLYYSDVPTLREALRKKYSSNADTKIEKDYTRTKQDFHRMDLDKMDEYHPISRPHMRATYFAYLQAHLPSILTLVCYRILVDVNNPGSRKAVYDCVKQISQKEVDKQKKGTQKQNSDFKEKPAEPVAA
ncbi:hypothetical protein NP493_1155g00126 [Ridgeia piscesae]|uniref:Uncharacterized protein n=1 Tax=Ridgeia piscesae TaxID=27915 RepID=A0AAD9KFC9_RIDPI|nr:hypothetical protein NP493_1155g00126 [Ridgeia piscesae]